MTNNNFESVDFSPIVIFAFNRPDHLQQVLSALSQNEEFNLSPFFIYCDGPRNKDDCQNVDLTRSVANQWPHPNKSVIEAHSNQGLAESVIVGVTQVVQRFGRVIVLEDDLIVERSFLNLLNRALKKYENDSKVMQVSAYMFPIPEFRGRSEALFLPNISSWGWGTWSRAWSYFDRSAANWELLLGDKAIRSKFDVAGSYEYSDMLFRQMMGKIDSWAIRWNWSVYRSSGLVVYPPFSLVRNIGFDGSGTHCVKSNIGSTKLRSRIEPIKFSEDVRVRIEDMVFIEAALKRLSGPIYMRLIKRIRNNLRRVRLKYGL
jgi:hypothetical protein